MGIVIIARRMWLHLVLPSALEVAFAMLVNLNRRMARGIRHIVKNSLADNTINCWFGLPPRPLPGASVPVSCSITVHSDIAMASHVWHNRVCLCLLFINDLVLKMSCVRLPLDYGGKLIAISPQRAKTRMRFCFVSSGPA